MLGQIHTFTDYAHIIRHLNDTLLAFARLNGTDPFEDFLSNIVFRVLRVIYSCAEKPPIYRSL